MDYTHLVENGTYKKSDIISAADKNFIDGMEFILETEIKNFIENYFIINDPEKLTISERLKYEVIKDAIDSLEEETKSTIAQVIISIIDEQEAKK